MVKRIVITSPFAYILGALSCIIFCSCSTPTVPNDDSSNSIGNKILPSQKSDLITDDILRYYVFDTLHSYIVYHFNGMCYAKNGKLVWDPKRDESDKYRDYRLSGDTLAFSYSESVVETYLRETNDGSALGGRWIRLEDESEIFTPKYLIVSGLTAIWEYSLKDDAPITSTEAFTLMMQDIVAEQDGTWHPHQMEEYNDTYVWNPDWNFMFTHEVHLTEEEWLEYCAPCEDFVRTNTSIAFTRKGKRFELSAENLVHNEKKMSYPFKIVADGDSCLFHPEMIDATEDVCLSKEYATNDQFTGHNLIEGHAYTALGKDPEYDKFRKCFKGLFE